MRVRPLGSPEPKSNRKEALLVGDAVPKPLGFNALPPEWLIDLGRLAPPRHSGRWVGAPVASLRCRILRPGEVSISRCGASGKESDRNKVADTR
jgi:hypothetical protein